MREGPRQSPVQIKIKVSRPKVRNSLDQLRQVYMEREGDVQRERENINEYQHIYIYIYTR